MKLSQLFEADESDIHDAKMVLEWTFREFRVSVRFSSHLSNERLKTHMRESGVTKSEIIEAFQKLYRKYRDQIKDAEQANVDFKGVLQDEFTNLNIPFNIMFGSKQHHSHKPIMVIITVMRKDINTFVSNVDGGIKLRV